MTISEMHIQFDIELQSLNSKRFGEVEPEEKDVLLNNSITDFVDLSIDPDEIKAKKYGFEDSIRKYQGIEKLIRNEEQPYFTTSQYPDAVYTDIPTDCYRYIRSRSSSKFSCNDILEVTTQNYTERVFIIPFVKDTHDTNLYRDYTFTINSIDVFKNEFGEGFNTQDAKFVVINKVLDHFNSNNFYGLRVTFENYKGKVYRDSYVFVTTDLTVPLIILSTSDGQDQTKAFTQFTYTKITPATTNIVTSSDRLIENDDSFEDVLVNSLTKTKALSLITTLQGNKLFAFYNLKSFLPQTVNIRYVTRPAIVSSVYNVSCDLNEDYHKAIVRMAAQRASAITQSKNYVGLVQENNNKN